MASGKKKIPLSKPVITKDMVEAAINALQNEKLVLGESVYKFEEGFAKYIGVKYAVATNSGTSALILAYRALGISNGVGFAVPSATFISTASAGAVIGGTPVFTDISLTDYTLDVNELRVIIEKSTIPIKVIVPVHLYGYPADLERVMEICESKGIYVLEDAAQAHGAMYKGKKVGSWGHVAIFSFYPIKNMTVGGDGGILVTNNEDIAEVTRKLRDCGRRSKYVHDMLGYVFRLNTVNAAIGRVQLKYLDAWNERRREIAALYDKLLSDIDLVKTPPKPDKDRVPVYHLYVIRLPNENVRNALGAWLKEYGVETLIHYPLPLHEQPALKSAGHIVPGTSLAKSEEWSRTVLSLPMFVELSNDDVKYVCEAIHEFFDKEIYKDKEAVKRGYEWLERYM